jgi:FHS family glucose/mannose:H+ symporter-like MFS transporter
MSLSTGGRPGTLLVLCAVFLSSGLVMAALGPALPDLAAQTASDLSELGRLFVAIFTGALAAQVLGGPTSDRFGRRIVLVVAWTLYGVGTVGVAWSTRLWLTLASAVILGLGYGGSTLAANVLASELSPRWRASTVNLVNVFYAAGAMAGLLVAGLFLDRGRSAVLALWVGAALVLVLTPLCARAIPGGVVPPHAAPDETTLAGGTRFVVSCGVFLLLYVGSENAAGAWAGVYLQRSTSIDPAGAATATAVFWLALCAGRMLAALAGRHLSADRLLVVSLTGSLLGALVLVAGHGSAWATIAALATLGVAFGPIYPTVVAIVTGRFPRAAAGATSRMGVLASLGGLTFPWLHGLVLTHGTTMGSALVTLATLAVMCGVWALVRQLERAARPASAPAEAS